MPKTGMLGKTLSIMLAAVIIATVAGIVYFSNQPNIGDQRTEFYILGVWGKAGNYPQQMKLDQEARMRVGIVNREPKQTSYQIRIEIDRTRTKDIGPLVLTPGQKWENQVSFMPIKTGTNQQVELVLYKDNEVVPYLTLFFWIDVT